MTPLQRRVAALEKKTPPDEPPLVIRIVFVSPDPDVPDEEGPIIRYLGHPSTLDRGKSRRNHKLPSTTHG